MSETSAWDFSDAWVMTAVAINGDRGCDLSELIGAADACNHAILTDEELSQRHERAPGPDGYRESWAHSSPVLVRRDDQCLPGKVIC